MKKLWQQVREFIPMAAFVVLCLVSVPFALADTSSNDSASTTKATQQPQTATDVIKPKEAKPKAASKPASQSALDDEMLNSPISYFREAFSSEEEEDAGTSPGPDAVTMTVKALVATLLSTIL